MHTGLKYPYVSTPVRCIVAFAQGCWVVIDFPIILLYFVEIYIHRIHVYKKNGMCRAGGGHSTFFLVGVCHTGFQK